MSATTLEAEAAEHEEVRIKAGEMWDLMAPGLVAEVKAVSPPEQPEPRRVEEVALELWRVMQAPEFGDSAYDVSQLLARVIELRRAEEEAEGEDPRGEMELARMQIIDIVRRIQHRIERSELDYPESAAAFIFDYLDAWDAKQQAKLLGVSDKTITKWKNGGKVQQQKERVVLVAQLLTYLRFSMTQTGLRLWFENSMDRLGGKTPLQLLEAGSPDAHQALIDLARAGRGQLAG